MGKPVPEMACTKLAAYKSSQERDPSAAWCTVENSGASYRNFLIGNSFQEAGKLARHQMFVTSYKELQSKPFRRKLLL